MLTKKKQIYSEEKYCISGTQNDNDRDITSGIAIHSWYK